MIRIARAAALALLLALSQPGPAVACGFHGAGPVASMVEKLLASDHIVLARTAPGNPFQYAPVEAIVGGVEHVDLPFLVDSVTRRRLAAAPEASVLFARDGAYGPWERLAFVDGDMRPVIDAIAARLQDWQLGGDEERFAMFAGLLDHPSRAVHDLALRELDQASYEVLKASIAATGPVDADRLIRRLAPAQDASLKPMRILLLGLSGDPRAKALMERGLTVEATIGGQQLGAYATAYLELAGPRAAPELAERYLTDGALPVERRELFVEALALNSATGSPEMQSYVRGAVAAALESNPELAISVARQFGARGDWSFAEPLERILKSGGVTSALGAITLTQYVSLAAEAAEMNATAGAGPATD